MQQSLPVVAQFKRALECLHLSWRRRETSFAGLPAISCMCKGKQVPLNELFGKALPLLFDPIDCMGQSCFSISLNSWVTRSLCTERKEGSLLYCQHAFLLVNLGVS